MPPSSLPAAHPFVHDLGREDVIEDRAGQAVGALVGASAILTSSSGSSRSAGLTISLLTRST